MRSQGVLLLGGGGFLGRALSARLKDLEKEYYVVGRSVSGLQGQSSKEYYVGSLDNIQILKELLPRCSTVVHLASDTTPSVSALQPAFEVTSNLLPSLRLLEILQSYPHVSLVYISTGGAIYGDCFGAKATEGMHLSPLSYYGAGKAAFEKFIHAYSKQTGNKAVILRPSNLYGPGQPYRPGFGVIPTVFHHLQTSKKMEVWGDGETVRDYLYLDDFVNFCVQLLDHGLVTKTNPSIYNIGSGVGTTLNELCLLMEEISGNRVIRQYKASRAVDVKKIVLDCSRVKKDYQWNAMTDLRSGLVNAWEWFCTQ